MSLLQRVERAQQAAETPSAGALVPVVPPTPPAPPTHVRNPAREELMREVRVRLQAEVVLAFDTLLDVPPDDVRAKVEGMVERVLTAQGYAVTRDERMRLIEEMVHDVTGLGPLEPLLQDETITEVMVNGPTHIYIERGRQDPARRQRLPERRARPADHRPDHHPDGPADRRLEPEGRCPPARRLARQRDHRAALAHRAGDHGPQVLGQAVHRRRPRRLRHGDRRDVRVPAGLHRGPAQPLRLRRHGLGQDDDPQRPLVVHPERRADRHDRGRRRAPAPPGARRHPGVAPAQPRGRGRDHDPEPAAQRHAHAPRPDHRRRVPRRRGAGHAPGDDDRPRRLALDRPRQQPARTCSGGSRRWSS